jgi:hypothetical protein
MLLENKRWLFTILQSCGLDRHSIPHTLVQAQQGVPYSQLTATLGNSTVVVQGGLTKHGGTSGSDTSIVRSQADLEKSLQHRKGMIKISKYVEGYHGNLTMIVGNTIPSNSAFGCTQTRIDKAFDFSTPSLPIIEQIVKSAHIQQDSVIAIPYRASVKIVGELVCVHSPLEGAVHDLNYVYPKKIHDQL